MTPRSVLAAAAVLLALSPSAPLRAQADAEPADSVAPHRYALTLAVGRPNMHGPEALAELFRGSFSMRATVTRTLPRGLEAALTYERSTLEPREDAVLAARVDAVALTGRVLGAAELPLQPFLEFGPALALLSDEDSGAVEGESSTQPGALVGTGVRVRLAGRIGALAGASLLLVKGPNQSPMYIFSGLHAGLTLGL